MAIGYSGIESGAQHRILEAWKEYKELFGLEGQKYHDAVRSGIRGQQLDELMQRHRTERDSLIEDWRARWFKKS